MTEQETDVVVIGSGFGGSVAALRFAEAGQRVVVLERGARVSRETFQADLDWFWRPERNAYGFHDLRPRGKPIVPWLGAAVGGGSHVFAGTLKRRESWAGFPAAIAATDMTPYYDRAEEILGGTPFPDWEPYKSVRATQLMFHAGAALAKAEPALVEDYGPVHLAISFAPEGGEPGAEFVNQHGCKQRYYDPREQSILGGDIDTKNSLDRNYLFLAERAGAEVRPLCEVDRIARDDAGFTVDYVRHLPATGRGANLRRRWLPFRPPPRTEPHTIRARRVVVACGSVGSTELLLRNRDTLPLGDALGSRYSTNGDYLTLLIAFRGLFVSWLGFVAMVVCAILGQWWGALAGATAYYLGLIISPRSYQPDIGTTNSDNIRFRARDGTPQGAYIESGRYPTPGDVVLAVLISGLTGHFRPRVFRFVHAIGVGLGWLVPPFGALARSWPIPLLSMGRDDAFGKIRLERGRAIIDYDLAANAGFYRYLDELGKKVARAAGAYWLPNLLFKVLGRMEVPHNQGGVPMGDSPAQGVVDHAGRVFGVPDLMVLDGSIIPLSVGPNPALTITALAERAMEIVIAQVREGKKIEA